VNKKNPFSIVSFVVFWQVCSFYPVVIHYLYNAMLWGSWIGHCGAYSNCIICRLEGQGTLVAVAIVRLERTYLSLESSGATINENSLSGWDWILIFIKLHQSMDH
jgi:hypothetical protein